MTPGAIHSPDTIDRALQLQRDGWSAHEIAGELGMAESTVRRNLPLFGKSARPHHRSKPKCCQACEAQLLKRSKSGLCLFCEIEMGMAEPV